MIKVKAAKKQQIFCLILKIYAETKGHTDNNIHGQTYARTAINLDRTQTHMGTIIHTDRTTPYSPTVHLKLALNIHLLGLSLFALFQDDT